MKAKVTRRALEARLRRHLAAEGLSLKKCRSDSRWHNDFGDYYAVDASANAVRDTHIDLEGWTREAGLLKPFEELTDE